MFELTPGAPEIVWVVSRLEDDMSIFSLGRERLPEMREGLKIDQDDVLFLGNLPRLTLLPGVGGPGLLYPVSPIPFSLLDDLTLDLEKPEMLES